MCDDNICVQCVWGIDISSYLTCSCIRTYVCTYVPLQARKAVEARAQIQQKLAQKQKESKEEQMRILAAQAREMRAGIRVETANNGICLLGTHTSVLYVIRNCICSPVPILTKLSYIHCCPVVYSYPHTHLYVLLCVIVCMYVLMAYVLFVLV